MKYNIELRNSYAFDGDFIIEANQNIKLYITSYRMAFYTKYREISPEMENIYKPLFILLFLLHEI